MTANLNDPYEKALFEAVQTVYNKHRGDAPLYMVNVAEFVEAVKPVVSCIVSEELTSALHPEFGWYWREQENDG